MVHLHDEDEPHYDDATINNELQAFFDEWHYRILHSGLAQSWDRKSVVSLALDLFEMHGMVVTLEEKQLFVEMEDEQEMIKAMVDHIPMAARKTFEHFVLQLQLVVSTTTQVRHALEEGIPEEVARCFEGGEAGPGAQILKMAIVQAGHQIHEYVEMHKSWKANTEARIARLNIAGDEAEHSRQQLEAIQCQLDNFKGEQNAKSKSVLVGMASKNDKQLVHTIFSTWLGWLIRHKLDKDIHDMFKKQITDAEDALIAFKQKQLGISRGMLKRSAAGSDTAIQAEVLRVWYKWVVEEGHNKEMDKALEEALEKFKNQQQSAKDASKSVMNRMSAGNDQTLMQMCFQGWVAAQAELLADKEIDALAAKAEQQYKDFMAKKSGEAKGVLDRMSGASDSGLLHNILKAWCDFIKEVKEERRMEELINGQDAKFKSLARNQSKNAKSVASRCHQQEEENMIMAFFYAWSTEARVEHVIKHYGGKLDAKKGQLEAVQTMFRSFANQLEQGIGNTPRSQRKSAGRSKGVSEASGPAGAPPVPPS
jgi:hypothetical protein